MAEHNIFKFKFEKMYELYLAKILKKERTEAELDSIICWLTGYTKEAILEKRSSDIDLQEFFSSAPKPNENRALIKGSICGVKIELIEDPLMKEIRYLDKLVDELARGRDIEKIMRN